MCCLVVWDPRPPFFVGTTTSSVSDEKFPAIRKKVTKKPKFFANLQKAGIAWARLFAIVRMRNCLSAAHGVFDMHRKESLNFYQLWEVSNEIF